MEKLKHFSLFSGIESFKKALTNLGIDNELVGYSEFDKYASIALSAIHGVSEELNYGDITKIDETKVPDCDLITYGFPCQDISVAGLGKGIVEGETRSGLLFDALRIIKYKKPKYAIAENVKNLVGKKFKEDFEGLLLELESYGYNNYWKVLNAKDYGIPQNRERVFVVSIRKDVDDGKFEFPKPFDSGLRLKDLLQDEVEDKYYIDNERVDELLSRLKDGKLGQCPKMENGPVTSSALSSREHRASGWSETVGTLCARDYKDPKVVAEPIIVASRGRNPGNPSDRTVGSPTEQRLEPNNQGITNTLTTVQKDNLVLEPAILTPKRTEYGKSIRKDYESGKIQESRHNMTELQPREDGISNTLTTVQKDNLVLEKIVCEQRTDEGLRFFKGGVVGTLRTIDSCGDKRVLEPNELKLHTNLSGGKWDKIHESARRVYHEEGIAPTIPTVCGGNHEPKVHTDYRIRKLTPKECWRLMGFTDEDYRKARQALEDRFYNGKDRSNSQMYKMAGNSIVVDVLEGILKNLIN